MVSSSLLSTFQFTELTNVTMIPSVGYLKNIYFINHFLLLLLLINNKYLLFHSISSKNYPKPSSLSNNILYDILYITQYWNSMELLNGDKIQSGTPITRP